MPAKRKRMTQREIRERAAFKKKMQEEGCLPPDKPKLNRKKYIEEAKDEWNGRERSYAWERYLVEAAGCMMLTMEPRSTRASPEAIGAAKVLRLAVRLKKFEDELKEAGKREYHAEDRYEYIRDILEA